MVHKGEHKRYNAILHTRETRSLYLRDQQNFTSQRLSSHARKQAAISVYNDGNEPAGVAEIQARISILKDIYHSVYEGNRVLKVIASNIFREYEKLLKM